MGRLIDADKVVEHLEKVKKESASLVDMAHILGFQSVIDVQPTAYDLDKVVEQLEDYRSEMEQFGCDGILTDMIEIVKGGGTDETTK
jgi:hypothetical protein